MVGRSTTTLAMLGWDIRRRIVSPASDQTFFGCSDKSACATGPTLADRGLKPGRAGVTDS